MLAGEYFASSVAMAVAFSSGLMPDEAPQLGMLYPVIPNSSIT